MLDEQLVWLEAKKKSHRQKDLHLTNTKACVAMLREAKQKDLSIDIINELYLLTELVAKHEWGEGTIIDDFSEPDKFVIRCGLKEETI